MSLFFYLCNDIGFANTLRLFADYERTGLENVPARGPLLVIANHQSNVDPPIVARSVGRRTFFLAKREVFSNVLFRAILAGWGAYPVNRGEADLQAYRWVLSKLREPNGSITLFPEATRNPGAMGRAIEGPASIALRTGVAVLPVGIAGSEKLRSVLRVVHPNTRLRVRMGMPFRVEDPGKDRRRLLPAITAEMMGRIAELLPVSYRGVYAEAASAPRVHTKDLAETVDGDGARRERG